MRLVTVGLGERIRQVRGTRTQREFAALLDVDQNTLSKWELGKRAPPIERLKQLAEFHNVPVAWLFVEEGEETPTDLPPDAFTSRRLDQVERDLRAIRDDLQRVREDLERAIQALRRRLEDS